MIRFVISKKWEKTAPLAVVVYSNENKLSWSLPAQKFPASLLRTAQEDGFQGKTGGSFIVRSTDGRPTHRLLLLSAGPSKKADVHTLRNLAGTAAQRASDARFSHLSFLVTDEWGPLPAAVQSLVEGFLLGLYRFNRHKSRSEKIFIPQQVSLILPSSDLRTVKEGLVRGQVFAEATAFARDLINEPPSLKIPETLGQKARALAGSGVHVKVHHKSDIRRMKMNALLGVNRGSAHPPVLVHLHYKPAGRPRRRVAFVGKGITFDSGGLSLKPADGMIGMKYDMAGSAVVFGLFHALRRLRPSVEVHGITPLTENMPGHDAYKPGDVVRAMNGKTIEVLNTDAEGRVILADGLSYASRLPVDEIIDIATLTGAVRIALGRAYVGLMSNNESLTERLQRASKLSGEKLWPLPLEETYKEDIRSKVADIKNIGNAREAGAIIGGLFLQEFVDEKAWVHLDIASAAWNGAGNALGGPGATGVMVRTLLHFVLN